MLHPYLVWLKVFPGPSLNLDGFQGQRFWEVSHLLPPTGPSQTLLISFQSSTIFPIRASCCEATQASSYYHASLRWAVSVNGSLTIGFLNFFYSYISLLRNLEWLFAFSYKIPNSSTKFPIFCLTWPHAAKSAPSSMWKERSAH